VKFTETLLKGAYLVHPEHITDPDFELKKPRN